MKKCGHLPILCVLLLSFHGVLCREFARKYVQFPDEISNGGLFESVWRSSKQRRSVRSMGNGQFKTTEQTQANKPQYECGDRVLTVVLKHADASNIRVYGPQGDKLDLDHLSAFCGVSIKTTNTDVRLLFNYDSCYVKQESSKRVLVLSWYGTDLALTCPVSVTPPSMICKNKAMELTVVDGTADKLSVALNEEWAPLLYVATQCWHRELSNQGVLTFSVPYTSCGVIPGEDHYNVNLRLNDKMITLSCPYEQILPPVKDSGLSVKNQPLPQRESDLYHKPPTGFPTKAMASQVVKKQAFPVQPMPRSAARTPSQHHRNSMLPKLPSLPGSFNLAVNFPFSLPNRYGPRDHLPHKPVALSPEPTSALIPEPTSALTPDPTDSSSEFSSSVENPQPPVSYEQMQEETAAPVTEAPESEYQYQRYPNKLERPAPTSPPAAQEYQVLRGTFSSASLYRPDASPQNFPKPNPLQVNPALANLAQLIPPGYFLCSYNNQQPPIHPHMFQPPDPNQPLQYQKPSYQKPDFAPLAPVDPPVPPMKGYLQQQLLLPGGVASRPPDSGTPLFQPAQYFQTSSYQQQLYPSGYGPQGSTTSLSPTSPLMPINPQTETRPYPAFQDSRPLQPQYYSQPHGSVQQPWSTSPFQESRPFMPASSQTPEYLQYQTGGGQFLDPYQRSVFGAPVNGISSPSQYMPSPLSTFPYSFRPKKPSADVFAENTRYGPEGFFQPQSRSSVLIPQGTNTGNLPKISLPPPVRLPSKDKSEAQVPHSRGHSVRYMRKHHVHPDRPGEASRQALA